MPRWLSVLFRGACAVALAALAGGSGAAAAAGERARPRSPRPVRVVAGGDAIPVLLVGRGITTMLSLPEEAREALCGDLYDAATGAGGYVVQRSGNDLFVKPLRAAGPSNLFVKTEHATLAFELRVVDAAVAMRIVNVDVDRSGIAADIAGDPLAAERAKLQTERDAFERARSAGEREIAAARAATAAEAEARATAIAREWASRATVARVARTEGRGKAVTVVLGPYCIRMGGRTYLECVIRNDGRPSVDVGAVTLGDGEGSRMDVNETIGPRSSVRRVAAFDCVPTRATQLRVLDGAGAQLVVLYPFK